MDKEQHIDPKISDVEVILIGLIFALFDLIEIVIVFFALDDFWIIDITASIIFFYLLIKGVPPMRQLVCWLLELIPYVGALPLLTVGWALTVWADRHPSGALAKAGAVVGTLRGQQTVSKVEAKLQGSKLKKVGWRSYQQMERAEGQAAEWKERGDKLIGEEAAGGAVPAPAGSARPSTQPSGRRNVDGVGAGNGEQVPAVSRSRRELGEQPTPFEELEGLTGETPPEEDEEQSFAA